MTRLWQGIAAVACAMLLAGCCYKPCAYDPITGVMYGGGLEPCCCGPLDPFCWFCNGCEQPLYASCWPAGGACSSGCATNCCLPMPAGCCQGAAYGGLNCGPHTVLPSPAYGGVVPPGARLDGGFVYGGPIIDGGTVIRPDGMIETSPGTAEPSATSPSNSRPSETPPPAPPAEDGRSGAVVPWPMLPPSAGQPAAAHPARFQSSNGRWIPARR
ncbi:MAG TPA: hypothetical protein VML55_19045 [Planctomycetaceae bacterium]|nr:hypothetical protein [Planctomycetaceae bacterium]